MCCSPCGWRNTTRKSCIEFLDYLKMRGIRASFSFAEKSIFRASVGVIFSFDGDRARIVRMRTGCSAKGAKEWTNPSKLNETRWMSSRPS